MRSGLGLEPLELDSTPFVTVVMPIRNEALWIETSLGSVLRQDYPADRFEVVVCDGDSDDGTVERVQALAADAPVPVHVLHNPARRPPVALNLAIAAAKGSVVVRVDGHCEVAPDYLSACVRVLADTKAECVGGPILTVASGPIGRAIAAAQSSTFGVGGVAFRTSDAAGPVDTVAFGAYRRAVFDVIGGFDEALGCNEDDDLNHRLLQAGGTIWMDPSISSRYFSRATLGGLARQYYRYGFYKVHVIAKARAVPKVRHLVPGTFVAAVIALTVAGVAMRRRWLPLTLVGPYAMLTTVNAVRTGAGLGERAVIGLATITMHVAYGVGFLACLTSGAWREVLVEGSGGPGGQPSR